jgi:hypothetical protein
LSDSRRELFNDQLFIDRYDQYEQDFIHHNRRIDASEYCVDNDLNQQFHARQHFHLR